MTVEHENRATIRRYVDELNNRNFAILDRVVAETVSKRGLLRTESQQAPQIVTRQEYAQRIRNRVEGFPDYTVTILDMLAEGDRVMIYWERQFTHGEDFLGVSSTGKTIVERAIGIYRLREGRNYRPLPVRRPAIRRRALSGRCPFSRRRSRIAPAGPGRAAAGSEAGYFPVHRGDEPAGCLPLDRAVAELLHTVLPASAGDGYRHHRSWRCIDVLLSPGGACRVVGCGGPRTGAVVWLQRPGSTSTGRAPQRTHGGPGALADLAPAVAGRPATIRASSACPITCSP